MRSALPSRSTLGYAVNRRTPLHLAPVVALVGVLLATRMARAHDFWLVPNAFRVSAGSALEIRGQTSSRFPTSEAAVALDRITSARVYSATAAETITELSHSGRSLLLRHTPRGAGQRMVAVALAPRTVRESPASFRRYLELEGAPEALARYERAGRLPPVTSTDSLTRRYAKYAKTLVEVGRGGPRAFTRLAGHPVEFVPLTDPATLRPGDTLAVRLTFRGRPVAGAHLHVGVVQSDHSRMDADSSLARADAVRDVSVSTNARGVARFAIDTPGLWNVRTIHIVPAERSSGADWDVHWATLVFGVEGRGASSPHGVDSSAVAQVVDRFHDALSRGDSATALSLLAPQATILESGGTETVAEYRSHHLAADIEFARAIRATRVPKSLIVRGDVAWMSSTSAAQGEFRGRPLNAAGAELVVLERIGGRWRIVAIHWSSRSRRPPS